jgi:hypothetical protein
VMVTLPPDGTAAGAVYVVVAPLTVWAGLTEPQLPPPQLSAQSTPAFAESFVTAAASVAWADVCKELGGDCVKVTEMGGRMDKLATAVLVGSATDVAVRVTVFPDGTDAGAV